MSINRRRFFQLAGLVAGSAALAACDNVSPLGQPIARAREYAAGLPISPLPPLGGLPAGDGSGFAALSRLTFGPRVEERHRAAEIGLPAWLEEQLAPENIEDDGLRVLLGQFDTLNMQAHELHAWSDKLFDDEDRTTVPDELRRATLLRQIYSRRQLYEVMVDFWTDHFNISVDKGECFYLKTVDDRAVIRPHALGNFRDLLWASAHSPAMLVYLDQHVSDKTHPNENYAREIMELHTLGVEGGYSQQDVMELARCFTGWTVKEHFWRGEFMFDPDKHDTGPKTVLGMHIEPSGQAEAEAVIEKLATHPSTARFIAGKLARRFLGTGASPEIIQRGAQTFLQTKGDIRAVLRVIVLDGLLKLLVGEEGRGIEGRFKRPVHFITSALRQLNATTNSSVALHEYLARMGQRHFHWPTPDGYPDRDEAWLSNLQPRWQFALTLAHNEIEGTWIDLDGLLTSLNAHTPEEMTDQMAVLLLGQPLPTTARKALLAALKDAGDELPRVLVAGLIASPAFQWR